MKKIKLTNFNLYALVDDEDYKEMSQYKWRQAKSGYVVRSQWLRGEGKGTIVVMHRHLMNTPKGFDTDHIDMNRLNNQKANLRIVTRSQNMANTRARSGLSKYKGVSVLKRVNKHVAYIRHNYKQIHLGYFDNEIDAARAYNAKAIELFGDSAQLNDIT